MKTKYEEIVDVSKIGKYNVADMASIAAMAKQENLPISGSDSPKRLLLCIDVQNDFMEGGALQVPGSIGDVERITRFIYDNMEGITSIMCSLDTHTECQIFHPCWWEDSEGKNPAPYTIITYADVVSNCWHPVVGKMEDSIQYLKELEKAGSGKKKLCIWPYHCIKGTIGGALENEFEKMVYFHSVARSSINKMIPKGEDPYSEMYGIIKPEYSKEDFVNTEVLQAIEDYDEIYVVGEASSHCLIESVKQIAEVYANRPDITRKITVLEDCTSPIPGYEEETNAAFANLRDVYGIKFAKSTDIQFLRFSKS